MADKEPNKEEIKKVQLVKSKKKKRTAGFFLILSIVLFIILFLTNIINIGLTPQLNNNDGSAFVSALVVPFDESLYYNTTVSDARFVPYVNATRNVQLGSFNITASNLCYSNGSCTVNIFDQSLNMSSNVKFNNITVSQDMSISGISVLRWLYNQTVPALNYINSFYWNKTQLYNTTQSDSRFLLRNGDSTGSQFTFTDTVDPMSWGDPTNAEGIKVTDDSGSGFVKHCYYSLTGIQQGCIWGDNNLAGLVIDGVAGKSQIQTNGIQNMQFTQLQNYFYQPSVFTNTTDMFGLSTFNAGFNSTQGFVKLGTATNQYARIGGRTFQNFTQSNNTSTDETNLYKFTIPSNALAVTGDTIVFDISGNYVGSTSSKRFKTYVSNNLTYDSTAVGLATGGSWAIIMKVSRTGSNTAHVSTRLQTSSATTLNYATHFKMTSVNFSSTIPINITGTASGVGASSGDISGEWLEINYEGGQ